MKQFEVSVGLPAALLNASGDPAETGRWSLRDLDVGPDYAAAICVEGHVARLRLIDASPKTRSGCPAE